MAGIGVKLIVFQEEKWYKYTFIHLKLNGLSLYSVINMYKKMSTHVAILKRQATYVLHLHFPLKNVMSETMLPQNNHAGLLCTSN